ncbi:MAG: hypothetical protein WC881_05930, partial [Elusimicrobiota bacterium]
MAEDKPEGEDSDEVQGILNDLDSILSDLGGNDAAQAAAPAPIPARQSPASGPRPAPAAASGPGPLPPVEKKPAAAPLKAASPAVPPKPAPTPPAPASFIAPIPAVKPAAVPLAPAPKAPSPSVPAAAPKPAPVLKPSVPPAAQPRPAAAPQTPAPAGGSMSIELGPRKFGGGEPVKKSAQSPASGERPAPATTAGPGPLQSPASGKSPAPAAGQVRPPQPTGLKIQPPLEIDLAAAPVPASKPAPQPTGLKIQPPLEIDLTSGSKAPSMSPTAPAPAPAPAPASAPLPGGCKPPDPIPEGAASDKFGKDQIRRCAFFYLGKYVAERDTLVKMLETTAQTVSKKPLFLRRVLYQQVTEDSDVKELVNRARAAKAVTILGLLEGLPDNKIHEILEACNAAGIMFRNVSRLEVEKKSVAVDVV